MALNAQRIWRCGNLAVSDLADEGMLFSMVDPNKDDSELAEMLNQQKIAELIEFVQDSLAVQFDPL